MAECDLYDLREFWIWGLYKATGKLARITHDSVLEN
jgi:hypothetical protein